MEVAWRSPSELCGLIGWWNLVVETIRVELGVRPVRERYRSGLVIMGKLKFVLWKLLKKILRNSINTSVSLIRLSTTTRTRWESSRRTDHRLTIQNGPRNGPISNKLRNSNDENRESSQVEHSNQVRRIVDKHVLIWFHFQLQTLEFN